MAAPAITPPIIVPNQIVKDACKAATTANITLSGTQTVDTVVLVVGDRCLVKNQTSATQNGPYIVQSGAWLRAPDSKYNAQLVPGHLVYVWSGGQNDSFWGCTTDAPIQVGVTNITYARKDGADPWATITEARGTIAAGVTVNTFVMQKFGAALVASSAAQSATSAWFPLDSAQYAVPGKTVQVRLVASVLNNGTAPAATFTFHLYSFTTSALTFTLTAATGEQTAVITAPALNTLTAAYGSAFTMPAAAGTGFLLGVVTSVATIATSSAPELDCKLQVKAV